MKKNLQYIDNQLKNLKSIDYKLFQDAEKWLSSSKIKLDNFQANSGNPHYIAFDMLANMKDKQNDDLMNNEDDDDLLSGDVSNSANKNVDIIG